MGTRNLTCVFYKGEYKVAQYGQWDGYPTGQGAVALEFLVTLMTEPEKIETFKQKLDNLYWIGEKALKEQWIKAGLRPGQEYVGLDVADNHTRLYPQNSRDTGAKILKIVYSNIGRMGLENNIDFANDSLLCEWAYVIDLDTMQFEVYQGFNNDPLDLQERFYNNGYVYTDKNPGYNPYYPIKFVKAYSLHTLPTEPAFIRDIDELTKEDEGE